MTSDDNFRRGKMEKWKFSIEGAMNNKRIGGRDTSILYVRVALCTRTVDKWQTRGFIKNAFRQVSSRVLVIYKTHPRVSKGSTFHKHNRHFYHRDPAKIGRLILAS